MLVLEGYGIYNKVTETFAATLRHDPDLDFRRARFAATQDGLGASSPMFIYIYIMKYARCSS